MRNTNKSSWIILPFAVAIALAIGTLLGLQLNNTGNSSSSTFNISSQKNGKHALNELINIIDAKYVKSVDTDSLSDKAIDAILADFDPFTRYIRPSQLKAVNENLDGGFEGIGIEFYISKGKLFVVNIIPNGPSEKVGLKKGDIITSIEGVALDSLELNNEAVIKRLKGKKNTTVNIKVNRDSKTLPFAITRGQVVVNSIDAAHMLTDSIGYIKIATFSADTYTEFMMALEDLVQTKQMKHLVIDLRNNGGGYLQQATNILNQLFPNKELLVYTEGEKSQKMEYNSTGKPFYDVDKIAIITNDYSASASEIIAGAIQDNDRGILVGNTTFGKGLVQEQFPLRNGGALRLTVAKYYTPSGRCIQKPYETVDSTTIDSTKYFTKAGKVLYNEGGIKPDFLVENPLKQDSLHYLYPLMVNEFIYNLDFEQRNKLVETPSINLLSSIQNDKELLNQLNQFINDNFKEIESTSISGKKLVDQLHNGIIRYRSSKNDFYKTKNKKDPYIIATLKALKD